MIDTLKYEYKVMPLKTTVTDKDIEAGSAGTKVAQQVELILEERAREGWQFYQYMQVEVEIQKGCFNMFDKSPTSTHLYQVIFRRPLQ